MKCNICGNEMQLLDELENQESEVTKVYKEPYCSKKVDILFYQCPVCTHGGINRVIQEGYYQKYELIHNIDDTGVAGTYTETLLNYYERQFAILNNYVSGNEYILDIGCGPGIVLKRALKYFQKGIGVEPSNIQAEYAKETLGEGVEIINSFFDRSVDIPDNSMDAFICTQVFEHLQNIQEVAETALCKLKENGIGYIEVPNGQQIINESRYYDVFSEHINYFTVLSLTTLLVNTGFQIIKVEESFGGSFLAVYVRRGKNALERICFSGKRNWHQKYMNEITERYHDIAVWGVGVKARSFISLMKGCLPKHVFDSNSALWGGYLCNSNVEIEKPDPDKINKCEAVIIFAISYQDEIKKLLKEKYRFQGKIILMDEC